MSSDKKKSRLFEAQLEIWKVALQKSSDITVPLKGKKDRPWLKKGQF